jgi:hypothetical protein
LSFNGGLFKYSGFAQAMPPFLRVFRLTTPLNCVFAETATAAALIETLKLRCLPLLLLWYS